MAQYAYFDSTVGASSPVIGWYDTAMFAYPNLPASADLLALTPTQWAGRLTGQWAVSDGSLVAYTPPVVPLTLAQQAAAAIGAGLTITSASIPLSSVPFDCSATQDHINAEVTSLLLNGTFADGSATVVWTDIASPPAQHTMTVAQFKAFATAEAAYVAALYKVMEGVLTALPLSAVTIA